MANRENKNTARTITRRQLLGWGAIAGLGLSIGSQSLNAATRGIEAVDHLILGVYDLEAGIRFLEERTGVRAIHGGSHPNSGTRNALLSLGKRQYLELLAPDPKQDKIDPGLTFITTLKEPKVFGWMIATEEIEVLAKRLKSKGNLTLDVVPGSRLRPDGQKMAWHIALVNLPDVFTGLIQWNPHTPHPATDSPAGCSLRHFSIQHPDLEKTKEIMATLDLDVEVEQAARAGIRARLSTPKGEVVLE